MNLLIAAGPTREPIDPVRYLTNRSSGKMGYALAAAARDAGHRVTLISGPVSLPPVEGVTIRSVVTARDMYEAVEAHFDACDALIMAAAVADWTPAETQPHKIKKGAPEWMLRLVPTRDILASLSARKAHRLLVGFAAESQDVLAQGRRKRDAKRCDLLVANDITEEGAGFEVDTNRVVLLFADGREEPLPLMNKRDVAERILAALEGLAAGRNASTHPSA